MEELPKQYNPKETEAKIYSLWEKSGAFAPKVQKDTKPFTIVIPPPNVTGSLHMGHALNNTIQDILIRRSRAKGIPTLWLPGTDHAGIATQNVVEKKLAKEGKNRHEMGREEFIKEVEKWVDEYGHIIIDQLKQLGCSCDWSRARYTMDQDYAAAVQTAFKHYYDKGWIYQGERVINWCPRCQTSLSDIEVEYHEVPAKLYYFRYDKSFPITIATTRPETKLGDTAVAVNPQDSRYKKYLGQTFHVNFAGVKREIKIIADPSIDQKFGTGAVGVTPAHSLIDADLAEKNNLPRLTVIDQFGKMTEKAGPYEGLKVDEAREKIVEHLKKENLLEREQDIVHNLSVCYRCGREIEPQPSKQWFLKMSELIKPAIKSVENDEIKFTPEGWKKVYLDWMKNIRDWCISRQIWWGHRLPVWIPEEILNPKSEILNKSQNTNSKNTDNLEIRNSDLEIYVGNNPPEGYTQVSDVLDTWFSSALWPFATLGWPHEVSSDVIASEAKQSDKIATSPAAPRNDRISDLDYFYPTSTLVTARDINFLWVVRMIFSGLELMQEKPFSRVYINPTVFNKEGKRMSKSLGTGVDPLELIQKYGADATRFGLMYLNTGTQDIKFDEAAILAGQKFANKVWNISRFVMINLNTHPDRPFSVIPSGNEGSLSSSEMINDKLSAKTEADQKILKRLSEVIKSTDENLDNFRFGQAAHDLYDFVWHDFADIYIESSKLKAESEKKEENNPEILLFVLRTSLLLLHPFMPFVTEEIWQTLFEQKLVSEKLLMTASWPTK